MARLALPILLALAAAPACTPAAYAPPARPISLDSPIAPPRGASDVQAEVGRIGSLFGPDLVDGNVRLRHAFGDTIVVEGETGIAKVENPGALVATGPVTRTAGTPPSASGAAGGSRDAYTGRGGIIVRGEDGRLRGALTAGIGGGYAPSAGGWASFDAGASVGVDDRWARPWTTLELGANVPWASRPFVVQDDDGDDETTLELTSNMMLRWTAGLEIGPPAHAALVGLSVTRIYADTTGEVGAPSGKGGDAFVGVGVGFRARL